jgi:hypothetical protein
MSGASRFQSRTVLGEAVQRRAARYVANNHRNRSSVSNIIQRLKWKPLADRRKDARLVMLCCHCLDYRDTILALKASGVSNSTMSGASRFQSRTVLGKNDIFLVSIHAIVVLVSCHEIVEGQDSCTCKLLKPFNCIKHVKITGYKTLITIPTPLLADVPLLQ